MLKNFSKIIVVGFLGFCSGFPLLLTSANLQLWQASLNKPLAYVGALSLLGLPYLLKWLWAPVIDKVMSRFNWMRLMCFLLAVLIYGLSQINPNSLGWLICAICVSVISATLDIAIDAYRVDYLNKKIYGTGVASNLFGYRLGMIASGGGGLIIAGLYSWQLSYMIAAFVMGLSFLVVTLLPLSSNNQVLISQIKIKQQWVQAWNDLSQHKPLFWWVVLIMFIGCMGMLLFFYKKKWL